MRTDFTDDIDKEHYLFLLVLDIAERMKNIKFFTPFDFMHKEYKISFYLKNCGVSVYIKDLGGNSYEYVDISYDLNPDFMNGRHEDFFSFNRDDNSEFRHQYTFFEDAEHDLDKYLLNGNMNITEEIYFQYSLVSTEKLEPYENLQRYMDILTTETNFTGVLFHEKLKDVTIDDHHSIYYAILKHIDAINGVHK